MKKQIKLACLTILAGVLLISCNLPSLLARQLEETLEPPIPSPTTPLQASPVETASPEPQPTAQAVSIQLIDRSMFEEGEDPRYEIDGVWPNLDGPEANVSAFNAESDQFIEGVRDDFLLAVSDTSGEIEGEGEPPLSYLTFDYDLTYSDQRLFSIYLAFDQYIAISAHPFPFSKALNYDAQNGAFLSLADLFMPGADFITEIGSLVDPVLEDKGFGYQVGTAADVMQERENWNLLIEGLRINFDVYEVAPYAAGPQYISIPWGDLAGILDPNGPASNFID